MFEKRMTIDQAKELIEKAGKDVAVFSDSKWKYPTHGDDQKSCMMLDMNILIEQKPGIVIYIPRVTLEDIE